METLRRALAMLLRPARTWELVAEEAPDARRLVLRYAAPLAAIPAVCGFLGPMVLGIGFAKLRLRGDPLSLALEMLAGYLLTFVALGVGALAVAVIGRAFGTDGDRGRALQLVVYASTAAWLGGVSGLYSSLDVSVKILAAVYSLYTLWLGLPVLTGVAPERRLTFFGALLLMGVIVGYGLGDVVAWAAALGGPVQVF